MTVCTPWITEDDLTGDDGCGSRLDGVDPALVTRGLALAQEVLYRLSGERFPGLCTDVVRPCGLTPGASWTRRALYSSAYGPVWGAWGWRQGWGRCGHASDACGVSTLPRVALGRVPVVSVDAVWVDGSLLAASSYRIEDGRYLVRVDGDGWPCCQRLDRDYLTESSTFAVEFTFGREADAAAVAALMAYAPEVILALCDDTTDCRLPARVQTITRQGVTATVVDPLDFLDNDRTGVVVVDAWLKAVNPRGRRGVARVSSPIGKPVTRLSDPAGS